MDLKSACASDEVIFPRYPLLDGHIRFAYSTNKILRRTYLDRLIPMPSYICFDTNRIPFLPGNVLIDNFTCMNIESQNLSHTNIITLSRISLPTIDLYNNGTHCQHPSLFRCPDTSKCFSKHRLVDGRVDCLKFDENYDKSCDLNDRFRFRCTSENKCLSSILRRDSKKQCLKGEDESLTKEIRVLFQYFCNGFVNILAGAIDNETETDETHCDE